jgi:hypothetical protein
MSPLTQLLATIVLKNPKLPSPHHLLLTLSCLGFGTLSDAFKQAHYLLFSSDDFCCGGSNSRSIKKALQKEEGSELDLIKLLLDCVATFKDNAQYRNNLNSQFLEFVISQDLLPLSNFLFFPPHNSQFLEFCFFLGLKLFTFDCFICFVYMCGYYG